MIFGLGENPGGVSVGDVQGAWLHCDAELFERLDGLDGVPDGQVCLCRPVAALREASTTEEHEASSATGCEITGGLKTQRAQAAGRAFPVIAENLVETDCSAFYLRLSSSSIAVDTEQTFEHT